MQGRFISPEKTKKCPLNSPDIGIITENDHLTNNCLCQFCQCGLHICPGQKRRNLSLKSAFRSNYQVHHKKHRFEPGLKPVRVESSPNKQKIDLTTSNQIFYNKDQYKDYPHEKMQQNFSLKPSTQFIGRSQYQNEFPNWGPVVCPKHPHIQSPIRNQPLKFVSDTTYRVSHNNTAIQTERTPKNINRSLTSTLSFGPFDQMDLTTNYQMQSKDCLGPQLNYRVGRQIDKALPQMYSPSQFRTTSRSTYGGSHANPWSNIRLLKRHLSTDTRGN